MTTLRDLVQGRKIYSVEATRTVLDAARYMMEHNIGAVPVLQDGNLAGIFSERDFVNAIARNGAAVLGLDVRQLMSSPVISCHSTERIDAVLATMTLAKIRHVPVIDDGALKGIVSIGDLVKYRLDEKELEANVLLDLSRLHA